MKTLLVSLLCLSALGACAQTNPGHRVKAIWKYNYGTLPACGASQKQCVTGFQVGAWNGTACVAIVDAPNADIATGIQWVHKDFVSKLPGNQKFCLWIVWFDQSGNQQITSGAVEGQPAANANVSDFTTLSQ
jgi:hypothetical protein